MTRTGTFRLFTAAALAIAAWPVLALQPPAPCAWDHGAGVLRPVVDGVFTAADADVFPVPAGAGHAAWAAFGSVSHPDAPARLVVQDCAGGDALTVFTPGPEGGPIYEAWVELVFGPEPRTLAQIAEALGAMGAAPEPGPGGYDSCACDMIRERG